MINNRLVINNIPVNAGSALYIREYEKNRINCAFINISVDAFKPVIGVKYLWVLTQDEATQNIGNIYFGIENPLENVNAFDVHAAGYLNNEKINLDNMINKIRDGKENLSNTKNLLEEVAMQTRLINLGHPTIAVQFDLSGNVFPTQVYTAGELYYKNNMWYLNDKSGRFYHIQKDLFIKRKLLEIVAGQIQVSSKKINQTELKIFIDVIFKDKTPENIWQRYIKQDLERIGILQIGIILILKSIKYSIPKRFDEKLGEIQGKHTPEFNIIKNLVTNTPFANFKQLVDHCSNKNFLNQIKEIFYQHNQKIPDGLEKTMCEFIEFLKLKLKEEQALRIQCKPNNVKIIPTFKNTFFYVETIVRHNTVIEISKYPSMMR
ncbi:MAG: hypothetical protein JO131_05880 [Gammaproteobacteria bacterium]|nr:hypothetical protein [Gammaproteobacteria bacterium]